MRMEGISTSIKETNAKVTPDAIKLLDDEDYINFFTTCGPKFVSEIHRAQEVSAIFSFDAIDRLTAQQFSSALHKYINGFSVKGGEKGFKIPLFAGVERNGIRDVLKSLTIEILGYGLALDTVGAETLVATSLEEFNRVMNFALNSMGRETEDHKQIGMINGVTVIPWMSFPQFHNHAGTDYTNVLVRIPRTILDEVQYDENNEPYCQKPDLHMDDFGRCCEIQEIFKVDEFGKTVKPKCVSTNFLMPHEINKNVDANAEFVTRLSKMVRDKAESLSTLGQCVNTLRSFPKRFDYFFLQSVGSSYNQDIEMQVTVKELRSALDPTGDLGILSIIGKEQDEYFEMFYKPCLYSLYGLHKGIDGSLDPKYFMADIWSNHEECVRPNCLHRGMVWDRKNGGRCIEGILGRKNKLAPVPSDKDPHCAIAVNMTSGEEECKHIPNSKVIKQIDLCRKNFITHSGRSIYSMTDLIDYFCMPQLAVHERADPIKMDDVDYKATICSTGIPYPNCDVTQMQNVGDGFCDGYEFNTQECGWDGGDCDAFNLNTPNCSVPYPYLVGNGYCDGYDYDTLECNYDGGDCDEFKNLYPACSVKYPYLIGNGFCDGHEYNVEECGWDGGDCELVNTGST